MLNIYDMMTWWWSLRTKYRAFGALETSAPPEAAMPFRSVDGLIGTQDNGAPQNPLLCHSVPL